MSEPCSLLWIDIETTGLDIKKELMLELACFVTDPDGENPRHEANWVINPGIGRRTWEEMMIPFVREMHENSGLLEEVRASSLSTYKFEKEWIKYLGMIWDSYRDGPKFTVAGSGVGPFDLPYLKHRWGKLMDKHCNYFVMDVGVIGRFLRNACSVKFDERPKVPHRALYDLVEHRAEFFVYRDWIKENNYGDWQPVSKPSV